MKHEVKKLKNIAAVHARFCNTLCLQRVCCPALFASRSTISHHPAPSPPPVGTLSFSLRIRVHNLTPSHSLSASREYVVLLSLHPGPQSDTIPLPLHLQVGTSSYSLRIWVHNLTPSRSLSTSREYVVLLSSHPGPQSYTIPPPLHLQLVHCPSLFASGSTI